jgi:hypothetical protein
MCRFALEGRGKGVSLLQRGAGWKGPLRSRLDTSATLQFLRGCSRAPFKGKKHRGIVGFLGRTRRDDR